MKTKEEIEILKAKAIAGDAIAQCTLGYAYSSGDGVEKDLVAATSWFIKSAQQGYAYGQYRLGLQYKNGDGIKKDIHRAVEWLEKAAEQHSDIDDLVADELGEIYENGYKPTILESKQGVTLFIPNREEAFYWYERGGNMSEFNLARCYEFGIGTAPNLRKAYELYKRCDSEQAKARQEEFLKTYIPLLDTRIASVPLIMDNPYRILGLYTNVSGREIRANQSKINALLKVGREITFSTDHVLPCTYADYIEFWKHRVEYYRDKADSSDVIDVFENWHIQEYEQILETWKQLQIQFPDWKNVPVRDEQHISEAMRQLNAKEQRIKYALFWFCNATEDDRQALDLLEEQKMIDGQWSKDKFSSLLNNSVCRWFVREDGKAVECILRLIHNEAMRNAFISTICGETFDISETELSHLFWDALYEFPETELSWRTIDGFRKSWVKEYMTEDDINYIESKTLSIIRRSLDNALQFAEQQDKNDFDKSRKAYEKVLEIAPYQLLRVKRYLGAEDYRYKLLCNDVATKLLQFAICHSLQQREPC